MRSRKSLSIAMEHGFGFNHNSSRISPAHESVTKSQQPMLVVVRVRPVLKSEQQCREDGVKLAFVQKGECSYAELQGGVWRIDQNRIADVQNGQNLNFAHAFGPDAQTPEMYEACVRTLVNVFCRGRNAVIFAYGQTGSGKTFTMAGDGYNIHGLIHLAIADIFEYICANDGLSFRVRAAYFEIYNEQVWDLCGDGCRQVSLTEVPGGRTRIEGLSWKIVSRGPEDIYECLRVGSRRQQLGDRKVSDRSSHSHTILRLHMESRNAADREVHDSVFDFVDLAGSEGISHVEAGGMRRYGNKSVHKSLVHFGEVINALSNTHASVKHAHFHGSKLMHILGDSMMGTSQMLMICTVSPLASQMVETRRSLEFANKAMSIHTDAYNACHSRDQSQLNKNLQSFNGKQAQLKNHRIDEHTRNDEMGTAIGQKRRLDASNKILDREIALMHQKKTNVGQPLQAIGYHGAGDYDAHRRWSESKTMHRRSLPPMLQDRNREFPSGGGHRQKMNMEDLQQRNEIAAVRAKAFEQEQSAPFGLQCVQVPTFSKSETPNPRTLSSHGHLTQCFPLAEEPYTEKAPKNSNHLSQESKHSTANDAFKPHVYPPRNNMRTSLQSCSTSPKEVCDQPGVARSMAAQLLASPEESLRSGELRNEPPDQVVLGQRGDDESIARLRRKSVESTPASRKRVDLIDSIAMSDSASEDTRDVELLFKLVSQLREVISHLGTAQLQRCDLRERFLEISKKASRSAERLALPDVADHSVYSNHVGGTLTASTDMPQFTEHEPKRIKTMVGQSDCDTPGNIKREVDKVLSEWSTATFGLNRDAASTSGQFEKEVPSLDQQLESVEPRSLEHDFQHCRPGVVNSAKASPHEANKLQEARGTLHEDSGRETRRKLSMEVHSGHFLDRGAREELIGPGEYQPSQCFLSDGHARDGCFNIETDPSSELQHSGRHACEEFPSTQGPASCLGDRRIRHGTSLSEMRDVGNNHPHDPCNAEDLVGSEEHQLLPSFHDTVARDGSFNENRTSFGVTPDLLARDGHLNENHPRFGFKHGERTTCEDLSSMGGHRSLGACLGDQRSRCTDNNPRTTLGSLSGEQHDHEDLGRIDARAPFNSQGDSGNNIRERDPLLRSNQHARKDASTEEQHQPPFDASVGAGGDQHHVGCNQEGVARPDLAGPERLESRQKHTPPTQPTSMSDDVKEIHGNVGKNTFGDVANSQLATRRTARQRPSADENQTCVLQ